jgi:hypothetical protein
MTRKTSNLVDLLVHWNPSAPYADEMWAETPPVGVEFGASGGDAVTPLERLHGTAQRYDNL